MTPRPNPAWAFPSGWLQLVGREQTSGVCFHTAPPVQFPGTHILPSIPKFREGYLPLPQWHPSALANLVPSFPTPLPNEDKCLERSGLLISCKFSNRTTLRLFRIKLFCFFTLTNHICGTALELRPAAQKSWVKLQLLAASLLSHCSRSPTLAGP